MKSGLGDKIESFTKATGIKKMVDTVSQGLNIPCGCEHRKNMLNKMTKVCVSFVALALMNNYVLSHEDYKYTNEENTNLKTLSRHKRQCK